MQNMQKRYRVVDAPHQDAVERLVGTKQPQLGPDGLDVLLLLFRRSRHRTTTSLSRNSYHENSAITTKYSISLTHKTTPTTWRMHCIKLVLNVYHSRCIILFDGRRPVGWLLSFCKWTKTNVISVVYKAVIKMNQPRLVYLTTLKWTKLGLLSLSQSKRTFLTILTVFLHKLFSPGQNRSYLYTILDHVVTLSH